MAIEQVKEYFRAFGMEGRIQELSESSATVELAAQALHCAPERIAKTLSFCFCRYGILSLMAMVSHAVWTL